MFKTLKGSKSSVSSPPTDSLPPTLTEAREKYRDVKHHLLECQERKSALEGKVAEIGKRLKALPEERESLELARRNAIAGEALDPTKATRVSELDGKLEQLAREGRNLQQRREIFQGDLNGLTSINGGLEHARAALEAPYQALWEQVAATLAAQLPPGTGQQLLRVWTALNMAKPVSPGFLLEYVGACQPGREDQQKLQRELAKEFGVSLE